MEKKEIEDLIDKWKNGDDSAYEEIYKDYYAPMLKIAIRHTQVNGKSNQADAEDILQTAMLKAYINIQSLDDINKFDGWLTRIVTNQAKDYMKSALKKNNISFTDIQSINDDGEEMEFDAEDKRENYRPEVQLDNQIKEDILSEILGDLSEEQRAVTLMYYYDDMSMKEIASELGIEMSTVIGRLQTAKKNIKNEVSTIQKRDDIRLYNLSAIPAISFFMWLLGKADEEIPDSFFGLSSKQSVENATNRQCTMKNVMSSNNKIATQAVTRTVMVKVGAAAIVTTAVVGSAYLINNTIDKNNKEQIVDESNDEKKDIVNNPTSVKYKSVSLGDTTFEAPEDWDVVYPTSDMNRVIVSIEGKSEIVVSDNDIYFLVDYGTDKANEVIKDKNYNETDDAIIKKHETFGKNEYATYEMKEHKKDDSSLYTIKKYYCLFGENPIDTTFSITYISSEINGTKEETEVLNHILETLQPVKEKKEEEQKEDTQEEKYDNVVQQEKNEEVIEQQPVQSAETPNEQQPVVYSPSREGALAYFHSEYEKLAGKTYSDDQLFVYTIDDGDLSNAENACMVANPGKTCGFMPKIMYNPNNNQYLNVDELWDAWEGAPGVQIDDADSYEDYAFIFPVE